jgi:hypothetical protein
MTSYWKDIAIPGADAGERRADSHLPQREKAERQAPEEEAGHHQVSPAAPAPRQPTPRGRQQEQQNGRATEDAQSEICSGARDLRPIFISRKLEPQMNASAMNLTCQGARVTFIAWGTAGAASLVVAVIWSWRSSGRGVHLVVAFIWSWRSIDGQLSAVSVNA